MISIQASGVDRPPSERRSDCRLAVLARGALIAALAAVSACDNFSTETLLDEQMSVGTEQFVEVAFDDRLADGLEEYWSHCIADLWISPRNPGPLDLVGRCATVEGREGLSANGTNVWFAAAAAAFGNPIEIALPTPLFEFPMNFEFDTWPIQNCTVRSDTEVLFEGLRLRTLEARWQEWDYKPALRIKLGSPRELIAHRITNATADCPSGASENTVQNKLDKSRINGPGLISVDEMTISIYLTFERNAARDAILVGTDVTTSLQGIDVGIDWSALPGKAKEAFDASIASLGSQLAAPIAAQLSTVGLLLQPPINEALRAGHAICALEVRRVLDPGTQSYADQFVIRTQHPTRYGTPCIQTVKKPELVGQDQEQERPIDPVDIGPLNL